MKETRTVTIDSDQYEQICEYAQAHGQTVEAVLREVLADYIVSCISQRLKASGQ